ncbi:MAG: YggT family protein [Clostridia bacterium]|nr:YggT family protein [Clostridia bacterium]
MTLYPLIYVLVRFTIIFIELISLAMFVRAIMSWFFDIDGKFVRFLYVFTEPAIMPMRRLFDKMNWFHDVPIDMAYSATFIVLVLIQILLRAMVA